MPIAFGPQRVLVSCIGDIEVLSFPPSGPDNAAWVTLGEGELGEPGRRVTDLEPRLLAEHEGVIIGFKDVRSIDTIMEALRTIRGQLLDAGAEPYQPIEPKGHRPAAWEAPETPKAAE